MSHFTAFTVLAYTSPANLEVSAFSLSPSVVNTGESVTIRATITNDGDLAGSYTATLKINGKAAETKEVNVAGHNSQEAIFIVTQETAGTYEVSLGSASGTFSVSETAAEAPAVLPESPEPEPTPAETTLTTPEGEPAVSEETAPAAAIEPAPSAQPSPSAAPTTTSPITLWIIIGIVAVGIVIGAAIWKSAGRR